jgi:two-component system nitrate/nitrite response regulator NarL
MHKKGGSITSLPLPGGILNRQAGPVGQSASSTEDADSSLLIVVEPNPLLRDGLTKLLEDSRYSVLAASSSFTGLAVPAEQSPDIALIGGDDGFIIQALEECRAAYPAARRVVWNDGQGDRLAAIFEAGAHACLGRDVTLRALVMTLDLALLGASIVCCPATRVTGGSIVPGRPTDLPDEPPVRPTVAEVAHRLSAREVAILECLMHGDSNKLIAKKFQIAEATVKVHIKAILRKIRAANRTQAAIWAMSNLTPQDTEKPERAAAAGLQ